MQFVPKDQTYGKVYFPKIELSKDIKGILLDIDNTLYSYDECHKIAMESVKSKLQSTIDISDLDFKDIYNKNRKRVNVDLNNQAASHSRLIYFQKVVEEIFGKSDLALILELEKAYWDSFLDNMELLENVYEFLEKCQKEKVKICIITDLTAEIQIKKLLKLNISSFIDFLVTSEEAGVEKPHPYIFKLCLEKLKLNHDEVLVVGDNLKKDILGAELLKMNYIHIGEKND